MCVTLLTGVNTVSFQPFSSGCGAVGGPGEEGRGIQLQRRMIERRVAVRRSPGRQIGRGVDGRPVDHLELDQVDVLVVIERRGVDELPVLGRADGGQLGVELVEQLTVELRLEHAALVIRLDVLDQEAPRPIRREHRNLRAQIGRHGLRWHRDAVDDGELHDRAVGVGIGAGTDRLGHRRGVLQDDLRPDGMFEKSIRMSLRSVTPICHEVTVSDRVLVAAVGADDPHRHAVRQLNL
jgi:hypothetical protein